VGYETQCRVRVDDRAGSVREGLATVLLETDEIIVRGEARVRVPRRSIQRVTTRAGVVTITSTIAIVELTLGNDAAAKWHKKLEEPPKQLIDKLDVKPDAKVWMLGVDDASLIAQLGGRTKNLLKGRSAKECDVVFVGVESDKELDRIERGLTAMSQNGAMWVVHPKGPAGVADTTIFGAAKALGLTYTKVARVSDTHTAEKLVRPVAARSTARRSATPRSRPG
jgi:hypothetical protein